MYIYMYFRMSSASNKTGASWLSDEDDQTAPLSLVYFVFSDMSVKTLRAIKALQTGNNI